MGAAPSKPPPEKQETMASSSNTPIDPDRFEFDGERAARTIRFTTTPRLIEKIDDATEDILVVTHVNPKSRDEIDEARAQRLYGIGFRFRRYNADTQILVIARETKVHDALHTELYKLIEQKLANLRLGKKWSAMGADMTYWSCENEPNADMAEGHCCGGPIKRKRAPFWPSLVIGGADYCPMGRLREDMFWWFTASNHEVKVLLLAKIDRSKGTVVVEHWEEREMVTPREGAASTRAYFREGREVALQGSVTMTWDDEKHPAQPSSFTLTGGRLTIRIHDLFLKTRQRKKAQLLVLTESDLQKFAASVWGPAVMLFYY